MTAKAGTEMKTVQQLERWQVYSLLGSSWSQSEQESPLQVWVSGPGELEAPAQGASLPSPIFTRNIKHQKSLSSAGKFWLTRPELPQQ